jgi:hypothetical protein
MKGPSPLLGYNTNVRHGGKLFHIQTEDSGLKHPHIITHLFADGGRIIASKKTSYAEHVGSDDYQEIVKRLMKEQHKAMFIALRDGEYDEGGARPAPEVPPPPQAGVDVEALEAAAARLSLDPREQSAAGRYQVTRPAAEEVVVTSTDTSRPPESIFGGDLLSEKSLDEVILSYLSEDLDEAPEE